MIPVVDGDLQNDFTYEEAATKTYKLNTTTDVVAGFIDEVEALKQAIYLILNVERYEHMIYSWNYGVEFKDLFGLPASEVKMELENRITEALLQDSRISAVSGFEFTVTRSEVLAKFTVTSIYGDIKAERVVEI